MTTAIAVLPLHSHTLPSLNQETYQILEETLVQAQCPTLLVAACDDIPLQRRLATRLDRALVGPRWTGNTWLRLDPQEPDITHLVMAYLKEGRTVPYLQILGVERLTSCPVEEQAQFLASLRRLAGHWPQVPWSIVLWLPRPWLRQVQRAAPLLIQRCDRVLEFLGDPAPLRGPEPPPPPLGHAPLPDPETPPISAAPVPPAPGIALWQQLESDLAHLECPPAPDPPTGSLATLTEGELHQGVKAAHRTLQVLDPETQVDSYGAWQTHLGRLYWQLAARSSQASQQSAFLYRAIAAYQEALAHCPPHPEPQRRAMLQGELGSVYWQLAHHERPQVFLPQAIATYQDALAYYTPTQDGPCYAALQAYLGTAYWDLGRHLGAKNPGQRPAWERAIAAYTRSLDLGQFLATLPPSQGPDSPRSFDPWATHQSLGVVHDHLAVSAATPEAQTHHWQQAIRHYLHALEGWRSGADPRAEDALAGILNALRLQAHHQGLTLQHRSLAQIPPRWLPEIWRQL